jgi:acyltransferase-like protein
MKLISAKDTTKLKQERLHYLDWLRVLVVLGVFYAHTIYIFDILYWHSRSEQQNLVLEDFVAFSSQWGMSLLFFLAGAGAWFTLRSRTGGQFLRERFKRLAIPFLVGFILLSPLQSYLEAVVYSRYHDSLFQFYLYFFAHIQVGWNLQWLGTYGHHLWFLAFLFLISVLALPVILYLKREQDQRFTRRLAALSVRRGGLLVFVLPLALIQIVLGVPFPGYQNWADFCSWLAFYLCGYILLSDPRFGHAIEKQGKVAVLVGIICYLVSLAWEPTRTNAIPDYSVAYLLYLCLHSIAAWSWIVFILYVGMRFLNVGNRGISYGNEAVLPFYILHYPVILITAFCLMQLNASIVVKFLLISTSSLITTLALYELLIRRVNVMRWLFGMKPHKRMVRKDMSALEHIIRNQERP